MSNGKEQAKTRIVVYFTSGHRAVFDAETVEFRTANDHGPDFMMYDYTGKTIVN